MILTKIGLLNSGSGALCWVSGLEVNGLCDQAGDIQAPMRAIRRTSKNIRFIISDETP